MSLIIALRGYRSEDKYGDMLRSTEDSDMDEDESVSRRRTERRTWDKETAT